MLWKIVENRTLKRGSSPPEHSRKRATLSIDLGRKICHSSGNEQEGSKALSRRALSVDIYKRGDHLHHVVWKDETGRGASPRGSLEEAKNFQTQKFVELERHREGSF